MSQMSLLLFPWTHPISMWNSFSKMSIILTMLNPMSSSVLIPLDLPAPFNPVNRILSLKHSIPSTLIIFCYPCGPSTFLAAPSLSPWVSLHFPLSVNTGIFQDLFFVSIFYPLSMGPHQSQRFHCILHADNTSVSMPCQASSQMQCSWLNVSLVHISVNQQCSLTSYLKRVSPTFLKPLIRR